LLAVIDAAGSERAAIVGLSEGGPLAILFSAAYPERVSAWRCAEHSPAAS
jgi:pimeloyl-ACP methyl ester carboxylesterase